MERVAVRDALRNADTPCVSAHRLVRLAAEEMTGGVGFELASRALGGAFPYNVPAEIESWPLCGALAPHASRVLARIDEVSSDCDEPLNFTQALNQAALFYKNARADYTHARAMYEAALKIDEAALGPDHPEVATRLSNLASVLHALGGEENLKAARAALERALKIDKAAHGPDHPKVAIRLCNLANVLDDLGGDENLKAARATLERALKIDEAAYGPDHPDVAILLSNLATVLGDLGGDENLKAARMALERALQIDEAAHGPDHPKVGIRHVNMAPLLDQLGDRAGALRHAERGLAIFTASLGVEHGHTQVAARRVKEFGG